MVSLREALDRVWHDSAPRQTSASTVLREMDDDAVICMIKLFLLAEEGDRLIIDDRVEPGALYLRYRHGGQSTLAHLGPVSAQNTILRLNDIRKSLIAHDADFLTAWGTAREYSAANILSAEQFARDHVDTLLYEGEHTRERRLEQIGTSFGVSANLLLRLADYVRNLGPPSIPSSGR
jgi:hypothetical protein